MKYLKKIIRLISLMVIITLASMGLGFNAAIMPSYKRDDPCEAPVELVESREDYTENENQIK